METQARQEIVRVCQRLYAKGYLAAADGNISVRLDSEHILITPSGVHKGFVQEQDLVVMNLNGQSQSGRPSSESKMHLQVYRSCPQAQAVVHAHPPTSIAWSIARPELLELPAEGLSEVILAVGRIPFVPFALPGSQAMGDVLVDFLPEHRAMILSRHGALTWGEDLHEAYAGMERLESSAEILWRAELLGGVTSLPLDTVQKLKQMRSKLGPRTL